MNLVIFVTKMNSESEKSFYVYYYTSLNVNLLIYSSYII